MARPFQTLKGKRLLGSAGCFEVSEVPEELTDEPLDDLPYVELFYQLSAWKRATPFRMRIAQSGVAAEGSDG
jgi:hypothetical protein